MKTKYLQISRFQTARMATEVLMSQTTLQNIGDLFEEGLLIIKMCFYCLTKQI